MQGDPHSSMRKGPGGPALPLNFHRVSETSRPARCRSSTSCGICTQRPPRFTAPVGAPPVEAPPVPMLPRPAPGPPPGSVPPLLWPEAIPWPPPCGAGAAGFPPVPEGCCCVSWISLSAPPAIACAPCMPKGNPSAPRAGQIGVGGAAVLVSANQTKASGCSRSTAQRSGCAVRVQGARSRRRRAGARLPGATPHGCRSGWDEPVRPPSALRRISGQARPLRNRSGAYNARSPKDVASNEYSQVSN
jgi:hypothetical protein